MSLRHVHAAAPPAAGVELLVLAPCLPRPDGDACSLRWFHLLRFLARHFRVHLGCRADPLRDGAQFSRVRALCYETRFLPPPGVRQRIRLGAPQLDPALQAWAVRLCTQRPVGAVLACGARLGASLGAMPPGPVRIVDLVELESDQQRRRGALRAWPGAALWRHRARRLLAVERAASAACDHVLLAAPADVARLRLFAPESAHKAQLLASGVDPEHYSPHILQRSPYPAGERALVLAGPLDSLAAGEAACWLAEEVFAPLRAADHGLRLALADADPHARIHPRLKALARRTGVDLAGGVGDLRPWLAHAAMVLAPPVGGHAARMAVLAAMALEKPVLGLPRSLAGLACLSLPEALAVSDAPAFRARIGAMLAGDETGAAAGADMNGPRPGEIGRAARARVLREHDWNLCLAGLPALLAAAPQPLASVG